MTITAASSEGTAQAQATVFLAGQTPAGTPAWAVYPDNYNNGLSMPIKGMQNSTDDPYSYVIEYYNDGSAFAIRALDQTGQQIWRKNVQGSPDINGKLSIYPISIVGTPDGGLLVNTTTPSQNQLMLVAPDGTTKWTTDGSNLTNIAVGYDGTIYSSKNDPLAGNSIIVIDGATGNMKYQITPNATIGGGTVSNEPNSGLPDDPYPCKDHVPDIPPSSGPGGTFLTGPVVAANGHAYVVQTGSYRSFTYTSCRYAGGTNDSGITYYYLTSASGPLTDTSQLALRELTPDGEGATIQIASTSYSGQAYLGSGGFSATQGGPGIEDSWNTSGFAPDADGGLLVRADGGGNGSRLIRVWQNSLQYSVPMGGDGIAINENGAALIQQIPDAGVVAVNVDDGTSAWSSNNGRILTATNDGGVLLEQFNVDTTSSVFELDKNGALASPVVSLPGDHVKPLDDGEFAVQSVYGSIVAIKTSTAGLGYRFPVPADGNASGTKAVLPGTITKEITVIGWINQDLISIPPTTNVNPALVSGLNGSCLTTVKSFSDGDRHLILNDSVDRPYANAFLLYNSANGEPPAILDASVAQRGDYRLF